MAFYQTDHLWISRLENGVAELYLDCPGRPVNVLSRQLLDEIDTALDKITAEESFRLLLIRSGKVSHFVAGADITEFQEIHTAEQAFALSQRGQTLFTKLANLRMPTVAVVNGACLGGGLELALACDYRIVVDDPKVQMGLPEVELGLLPAWGGTQRLPRLLGLERGLQLILSARRLRARDAVRLGLADRLLDNAEQNPATLVEHPSKQDRGRLPRRNWRQSLIESNALGRWIIFKAVKRFLQKRIPDDMPAPWEAFEAVKTGLRHGFEAGLQFEREAAGRLALSPASQNLVRVYLAREQARKISAAAENKPIRRVGVVGAGVMGAGIVQLAALRGFEVVVQEVNETALGLGMFQVVGLFEQAAKRGLVSREDLPKRLAAVHGSTTWKNFDNVDLVIEAAVEDLEIKKALFAEIEQHVGDSAIIATNTSSLRVQDVQDGLHHPERIAGLHFFNPVHKMPLVEVVRAPATQPQVADDLLQFTIQLGKTPVLVQDSPGFLVNRILMPYLNEAVTLVGEGMTIVQVDLVMRRFGMPMGPLELLDQIGLDIAAHIAAAMDPVFGERLKPHPGFALMHSKGWTGQKTGVGFYRRHGRRQKVNHLAQNAIQSQAKQDGVNTLPREDQNDIARDRMVLLMVNEAAMCLGEHLVADAATLNLAMILGTGWAPHRGGPLQYAHDRGFERIIAELEKLRDQFGVRFTPSWDISSPVILNENN